MTEQHSIDREWLRRKYSEERAKRLRADGTEQFVRIEGSFAEFDSDPYADPTFTREPLNDEVEVLLVGGGLSNLLAAGRLREAGIDDIRIIDSAGDFGGTWYWNRYPGAACDIDSYVYLPLLEETGYIPTRKYAPATEIYEHACRIARHYDLYENACLQTRVTGLTWNNERDRWIVRTDRDDVIAARSVIIGSGPLSKPKLPGIPGINSFTGHMFHTSRWDYEYTGGSPAGGMEGLRDKRVAVIGTGSTGVQCIPYIARDAKELLVFQRTPAAVDVRGDKVTDPEWVKTLKPGWQYRRTRNFTTIVMGAEHEEDAINDGWTKMFRSLTRVAVRKEADRLGRPLTPDERSDLLEMADFATMEAIRARIDREVEDPVTAESLKPWYARWCKRPCFHDEYLPTFNRENVTLVDTNGRGVDRMTKTGLVANGHEYEVDCVVFATGFEVGTPFGQRVGYDIVGDGGVKLSEHWDNGYRTFQSVMVHGFPNLYMITTIQSGNTPNHTQIASEQSEHIVHIIREAQKRDATRVEVSWDAEQEWVSDIKRLAREGRKYYESCTPSYTTSEGDLDNKFGVLNNQYGPGPIAYFDLLAEWRAAGDMPGLSLTQNADPRARGRYSDAVRL